MSTTTQGSPRLRGIIRTVRSDIGRLLGTGMAGQALLVVSGPLVARMLGPTGRGQAALILAVATVCNFLSIASLIGGISRTVARRDGPARDVVGPFLPQWLLRCLGSAVVAAVVVAVMLRSATGLTGMVAVAALITLTGGTNALVRAMLLGEGNIRRVTTADVSLVGSYVLAVVVLFVAHRQSPVGVVMLAYLCGQLVSLALVASALRRPTGAPADPAARTEAHRYARRAYFGSIANIDRVGLDSVLIGHLLGATLLGLFAVANAFATVPAMIVGPLAAALLPRMAARPPAEATALMRRWVLVAAGLCLAATVVLWAGMGQLILLFFGTAFEHATWTGRFLLVANSAFALRVLLISAAGAQEREKTASRVSLVASVLALAGLALGAQVDGLVGATVGMTVAAVAGLAVMASVVSWTGRGVVIVDQETAA